MQGGGAGLVLLWQRFWNCKKQQEEGCQSNCAEGQKRNTKAERLYELAAERGAKCRAQTDSSRERTLHKIEPASTARQISHDQNCNDTEDGIRDSIEDLNRNECDAPMRQGIEHRANRQNAKADQQQELSPVSIGKASDEGCRAHNDYLRDDDAG